MRFETVVVLVDASDISDVVAIFAISKLTLFFFF